FALFLLTNLAVMVVFGLVLSLTGIQSSSVQGLMIMALLFGFGGCSITSPPTDRNAIHLDIRSETKEPPKPSSVQGLMIMALLFGFGG
ncbi:hypothetical protein ACUOCP_52945, partial [Escherichia sp. R-CC3]